MQKIGAWIRDPRNNLFKGQTKRAALYELFCDKPETCDLLRLEKSCLNCGALSPCRFGKKSVTEGPTRTAKTFRSTLQGWRQLNEGFLERLKSLTAYNRIFKANGHFYLPYSWMADDALKSKWVAEEDMTTELLERLCSAQPREPLGDVIQDYQKKEIPKFIADLKAFYPEIFDRLPQHHKDRLASVSYIGRTAVLTTCAPGQYIFSKVAWEWDGEVLRGQSMLFQPVKGDLSITIKPRPGAAVTITSNDQVTANTRFLD